MAKAKNKPQQMEPELAEHIRRMGNDPAYRATEIDRLRKQAAAVPPPIPGTPQIKPEDDPRFYWPKDKPFPPEYIRGNAPPCTKCRCVKMPSTNCQAVKVEWTQPKDRLAHFWCRQCGARFKMQIAKGVY